MKFTYLYAAIKVYKSDPILEDNKCIRYLSFNN